MVENVNLCSWLNINVGLCWVDLFYSDMLNGEKELATIARTPSTNSFTKSTKMIENQLSWARWIPKGPVFKTIFLFFLYMQRDENARHSLIFFEMVYYIYTHFYFIRIMILSKRHSFCRFPIRIIYTLFFTNF